MSELQNGTPPETVPQTASSAPQTLSNEDQQWGMIAHLASLINLVGIPSPLGPLIVWLLKRNESAFAAEEAKESLNFTLSVWIYGAGFLAVALLSFFGDIGVGVATAIFLFVVWLLILLGSLIFSIIGGVQASQGKAYRYPLNIRLVK